MRRLLHLNRRSITISLLRMLGFPAGLFVNAVLLAGILGILSEKDLAVAAGGGGVPLGNGDVNGDGSIDISDAIYLLTNLFLGGSAPVAIECPSGGDDKPVGNGDVNGDGTVDVSDPIYLLSSLFLGGPNPVGIECPHRGYPLPATGQTKCYDYDIVDGILTEVPCDQSECKGDGFYQAGCPNDGRFVDNGDGTVTDNCTGLMWQKNTADVDGNGSTGSGDDLLWQDALKYCEDLELAGHTDWRLPNVRELLSIVDYGRFGPAIDPVFGAMSNWWYWSSSSYVGHPCSAWGVLLSTGFAGHGLDCNEGMSSSFVRAVRGKGANLPATGQTKCYGADAVEGNEIACNSMDYPGQDGFYQAGCSSDGRFVDNGDGTVTDNCTGLMWQKDTADVNGSGTIETEPWPGDRLRWQGALRYCEDLSFAGHDDWRLPNVRELQSIVDYGRFNPAIDPVFGAGRDWHWSSTSDAGNPVDSWVVLFEVGLASRVHVDDKDMPMFLFVRAVRNAQ